MAKTVFKFAVEHDTAIQIPIGAEILHVDSQYGKVCVWALVDTRVDTETKTFMLFYTGENIPDALDLNFVGTAIQKGRSSGRDDIVSSDIVYHVFEKIQINNTVK